MEAMDRADLINRPQEGRAMNDWNLPGKAAAMGKITKLSAGATGLAETDL
jgi:hypothetical protein